MEHNYDVIMHKKSVIIYLIKDFREIIKQYGFRYKKKLIKILRRRLRSDEKAADDEDEDDIGYLQEIIDRSSTLSTIKHILNEISIMITVSNIGGIESIKYLFNDEDENYGLYLINNQQYQSFSGKILLAPNEYLKKIKS